MDKKLVSLLVSMLMCATIFSVAVTGNYESENSFSNVSRDIDWWPMLYHDAQRTGFSTSDAPDTANIMTQVDIGSNNNPLIVYNGILVGGAQLIALDANNSLPLGDTHFYPKSPGAAGEGKFVYPTNTFGLVCLGEDPDDWDYAEWYVPIGSTQFSSPIILESKIYIAQTVSTETHITCFYLENGSTFWDTSLGAQSLSDIAIDDEKIYITANRDLFCLDMNDGQLLWQTTVAESGDMFAVSTPVVTDGMLYTISLNGVIYGLDAVDGSEVWNYSTGDTANFGDSPSLGYGNLYVGTNVALYCFNLSDPTSPTWIYSYNNKPAMTPIVADGKVYVRIEGLRCIDAMTGDLIWTSALVSGTCPLIANGILYYLSQGIIYFFNENTAPDQPTFTGPNEAPKNTPISFYVNASDPDEGDTVYYLVDWTGNGKNYEEFGPYPSGVEQDITHEFTQPHYEGNRTFHIYCRTKDDSLYGAVSSLTGPHDVFVENHAPDDPEISGPDVVYAGYAFTLQINLSDPDNDSNLALGQFVSSGPGSPPEWVWSGNYNSGTTIEKTYRENNVGTKTYIFKTGERNKPSGDVLAESNIVNYTFEVVERPNVAIEVENVMGIWGGFGKGGVITAEIVESLGEYPAENVNWSIDVVGGVLKRISVHASGTFDEIPIGGSETISTEDAGKIFGLGPLDINITVTADYIDEPVYKLKKANALGPFIISMRDA